jgi:hypothetical protein
LIIGLQDWVSIRVHRCLSVVALFLYRIDTAQDAAKGSLQAIKTAKKRPQDPGADADSADALLDQQLV